MAQYYFVASALPPLVIGTPPELPFDEFKNLLKDNLSKADYQKIKVIRLFYDIQNIRSFWKGEELSPYANFDEVELEEALLAREGFPSYVYDFLDRYETLEDRLYYFPALINSYFVHESAKASGFLKHYLQFEREWRLVFTGFRAKQLGRDISEELQFEDPNDDIVAQILAQKDSKTYIPPEKYQELQVIFEKHGEKPMDLYQALSEYRFRKIEEMLEVDLFSIERILGYMVQLIAAEQWVDYEKKKEGTSS